MSRGWWPRKRSRRRCRNVGGGTRSVAGTPASSSPRRRAAFVRVGVVLPIVTASVHPAVPEVEAIDRALACESQNGTPRPARRRTITDEIVTARLLSVRVCLQCVCENVDREFLNHYASLASTGSCTAARVDVVEVPSETRRRHRLRLLTVPFRVHAPVLGRLSVQPAASPHVRGAR